MRMLFAMRVFALAALAILSPLAAEAQSVFPTPNIGEKVAGVGNMCLNSSGQMVPWWNASGTWQCSGSTIPTSGGGGGGGGAVTAASGAFVDGSIVTIGTEADTAYSGSGSATLDAILKGIYNAVTSSIPAGSNVIGGVTAADGALVTEGAKADAAYTGSGSASLVAALKGVYTSVSSSIPAGSALIGKVGIDQTTPGTTNGVQVNAALPAGTNVIGALTANQAVNTAQINGVTPLMGNGQTGTGAPRVTLSQDSLSTPINISTATTTQLVALSGSTAIYVTSWDVIAAGTGNITLEYGTGTACATGTTVLTGAYNLTAQTGISKGSGVGTVLKVPSGNALCALTSAAVQMSGSVSYVQF